MIYDDVDEGPSDADLERFGDDDDDDDETGYCPNCNAEVWYGADVCASCGLAMRGGPRSKPSSSVQSMLDQRLTIVLIVLLSIGLIFGSALFFVF